jgi:hypothetical protein
MSRRQIVREENRTARDLCSGRGYVRNAQLTNLQRVRMRIVEDVRPDRLDVHMNQVAGAMIWLDGVSPARQPGVNQGHDPR